MDLESQSNALANGAISRLSALSYKITIFFVITGSYRKILKTIMENYGKLISDHKVAGCNTHKLAGISIHEK